MAYVVTRLCIDCVDRGCVEVCPVDCIYALKDGPSDQSPNMLYIHPVECISCGACEPECPWNAIYEDRELPGLLAADVALNNQSLEHPSQFIVAVPLRDGQGRLVPKVKPTHAQVSDNKSKWGIK